MLLLVDSMTFRITFRHVTLTLIAGEGNWRKARVVLAYEAIPYAIWKPEINSHNLR